MRTKRLILAAAAVLALGVTTASARTYCRCSQSEPGSDSYGYYDSFAFTYGYRVTPHWSYSSTRQPYAYQGDGSYYGLGYSGYYGDGASGSYWYW